MLARFITYLSNTGRAVLGREHPPAQADGGGLTREQVQWAYRILMEREVDDEISLAKTMMAYNSLRELRTALITSIEFRQFNGEVFPYSYESQIVIKELADGSRLFVDLGDVVISQAIVREMYETDETHFVAQTVKPGWITLDVGANIGYFTMHLARLTGSSGHVYAFEPYPPNARLLTRSLAENGYAGWVTLEEALVGDVSAERELVYLPMERGGHNSGGAFLRHKQQALHAALETVRRPMLVLDEYPIAGTVSFIKVDVEGAEPLVFRGAADLLRRDRPLILSEINPAALSNVTDISPDDYIRQMESYGYECRLLKSGRLGARLTSCDSFASVVFAPK